MVRPWFGNPTSEYIYCLCITIYMANKNYDKYLDMLMRNYPSRSRSDDSDSETDARRTTRKDVPFGGFPPIYLCPKDGRTGSDEPKVREYSTHKTAVSIKDIMKKRRETTPFI